MFLIVGLGNPGEKYEGTRHNAGFSALDAFAEKNEFPGFRLDKRSNSLVSEGAVNDAKTVLAKPQTLMNNSGLAVKSLTTYYSLPTAYLLVVHDDIDLPLGKIKVSVGRGSAGHKGIEALIKHLGTKQFARIRLGIRPKKGKPADVEKFVLKRFAKEESKTVEQSIEQSILAIETILEMGAEKAMSRFNQ